jgi:hypothetical protein
MKDDLKLESKLRNFKESTTTYNYSGCFENIELQKMVIVDCRNGSCHEKLQ